jgi:Bacterial regulatory helix-turn-helix protein, lysR family
MPAVEDEWAVNSVGCESRGNRNSVVHAFAEHLNYSEASRRIHVAQPAISQTILDLEEELGSRVIYVFHRSCPFMVFLSHPPASPGNRMLLLY